MPSWACYSDKPGTSCSSLIPLLFYLSSTNSVWILSNVCGILTLLWGSNAPFISLSGSYDNRLLALFPDPLVDPSLLLHLIQLLPKRTFDQSIVLIRLLLSSEIISCLCITAEVIKYGIENPSRSRANSSFLTSCICNHNRLVVICFTLKLGRLGFNLGSTTSLLP